LSGIGFERGGLPRQGRTAAVLILPIGLPNSSSSGLNSSSSGLNSSSSGLPGGSVKFRTTLNGHTFSDGRVAADPPATPEDDEKCKRFRQNENRRELIWISDGDRVRL
jgi:hypothetical protein